MARHKGAAPENKETPANREVIDAERNAANELALMHQTGEVHVKVLAAKLGYFGPMDSDSLEQVANAKAVAMEQSIFEFGAVLLMLRESCLQRGEWGKRLERLKIEARTARNYMAVALRFAGSKEAKALAHLGMRKLLELNALEDGEIKDLEDGKSARGLTLDKIDRMSVAEMRANLRKAETESKRSKAVIDEINTELMDLKLERKVVAHTDWPDALVPLTDQVAAAGRKIAQGLSELEACRIALFAAGVDLTEEDRVRFEAAIGHVADVYEEALARTERNLEKERQTFDQTLGGLTGGAE